MLRHYSLLPNLRFIDCRVLCPSQVSKRSHSPRGQCCKRRFAHSAEYLLIVLLGIQPTELRCQGATLSVAKRSCLDSDYILRGQFHESPDASKEKLKLRRRFVPASQNLPGSLSEMGIRAARWTNTKWNIEYFFRIGQQSVQRHLTRNSR